MWEDGATHQDGDLLDDLDASVPGLPRLLRLAHGLLGRQIWGIRAVVSKLALRMSLYKSTYTRPGL